MPTATTPVDCKTCYQCGRQLPADRFGRRGRKTEVRKGRCRECDAAYMRAYRRRRRAQQLGNFVLQLRREPNAARAAALASAMTFRFGGVDALAEAWKDEFDAAAAARPGSRFVLSTIWLQSTMRAPLF